MIAAKPRRARLTLRLFIAPPKIHTRDRTLSAEAHFDRLGNFMRRFFVVLYTILGWGLAGAPATAQGLVEAGWGVVQEVVDGDTLVLDGGLTVRLVGIQAPKLPLGRPDFDPQPLAPEAKAALEVLTLGRRVRLSYGGLRVDRYGRALAHLHDDQGRWIQGEMLSRGLARVYSFQDNRAQVREMLVLEAQARADRLGIWLLPYYAIRRPEDTGDYLNRFEVVEGLVLAAAQVRGRIYLNFGEDWRTDFTVSVAPGDVDLFENAGIDLLAAAGQKIRVRGWLRNFNGPVIDVTHPEQVESLGL